jgi:hypothetical protein
VFGCYAPYETFQTRNFKNEITFRRRVQWRIYAFQLNSLEMYILLHRPVFVTSSSENETFLCDDWRQNESNFQIFIFENNQGYRLIKNYIPFCCWLFNDSVSIEAVYRMKSGWLVNFRGFERKLPWRNGIIIKNYFGGTDDRQRRTVKTGVALTEIRNYYLPIIWAELDY